MFLQRRGSERSWQAWGEEGACFGCRDVVQFCFLEATDRRGCRGNSVANHITFLRVAETTNVPRHHRQAPKKFIHR